MKGIELGSIGRGVATLPARVGGFRTGSIVNPGIGRASFNLEGGFKTRGFRSSYIENGRLSGAIRNPSPVPLGRARFNAFEATRVPELRRSISPDRLFPPSREVKPRVVEFRRTDWVDRLIQVSEAAAIRREQRVGPLIIPIPKEEPVTQRPSNIIDFPKPKVEARPQPAPALVAEPAPKPQLKTESSASTRSKTAPRLGTAVRTKEAPQVKQSIEEKKDEKTKEKVTRKVTRVLKKVVVDRYALEGKINDIKHAIKQVKQEVERSGFEGIIGTLVGKHLYDHREIRGGIVGENGPDGTNIITFEAIKADKTVYQTEQEALSKYVQIANQHRQSKIAQEGETNTKEEVNEAFMEREYLGVKPNIGLHITAKRIEQITTSVEVNGKPVATLQKEEVSHEPTIESNPALAEVFSRAA